MGDLLERFMKLVEKHEDGCWYWKGPINISKGMCRFAIGHKKRSIAQRFSYEQFIGAITDGHVVSQICNHKTCVNPKHLILAPNGGKILPLKERIMDKVEFRDECWVWKGARSNGHPTIILDGKNIMTRRASYELFIGSIPNKTNLVPLCQNDLCVNPKHLQPHRPIQLDWTYELVSDIVSKCFSFNECVRVLGLLESGYHTTIFKEHVEKLGIDTSHFYTKGATRKSGCRVYILRNRINNLIYVGQTVQTLKKRLSNGHGYIECPDIGKAIDELGLDAFFYEEIGIYYSKQEANETENFYIETLNTRDPRYGYNRRQGGSHR